MVADAMGWWSGVPFWWQLSTGVLAAGLAVGVLAMLAGFLDYLALDREHPAQVTANWHMLAMSTAWLLVLLSVAGRGMPDGESPPHWASGALLLAWLSMLVGGWFGGTLVYRHGVGIEPDRDEGPRHT